MHRRSGPVLQVQQDVASVLLLHENNALHQADAHRCIVITNGTKGHTDTDTIQHYSKVVLVQYISTQYPDTVSPDTLVAT